MKRNVLAPFLIFGILAVSLTFLFTHWIGQYLNEYKSSQSKGQYLVNANDIQESIRVFLVSKDASLLNDALKRSGYDIILYDMSANILFKTENGSAVVDSVTPTSGRIPTNRAISGNSELKGNIVEDSNGSIREINTILSEVDKGSKVLLVDSKVDGDDQFVTAVIDTRQMEFEPEEINSIVSRLIGSLCLAFLILSAGLFLFIYFSMLRPFDKLQRFAGDIAKGNLEAALPQDRRNLFGAFTWAFDMMRSELKASKEREAQTEDTKKELVAALSHDIRTPVASVKAYAECLKSLPDKNTARGNHYVDIILNKTDEITKLSGDMFMHAIMDVEKLEIVVGTYKSRELLNSIFEPLILQYESRIRIISVIPDVDILVDKQRFAQICENIISNSVKYAPESDIHITSKISDGMLIYCFRDFGQGVLPEDIPFLFDKFFRGKNARESGQPGSGLGLYISGYILERTGGEIKAVNWHEDGKSGFQVEVSLRINQNSH